jgi:adenylate kinase
MRLILIGPPGSGKGTQARLLSQKFGLSHFSTGDILREAIRFGTAAGQQAEPYLTSGRLVPDDLVNEMVADLFRRDNRPDKFVMDGYPRTLAQAASFDQVLRQQFLDLTGVVLLRVPDTEIIRRLSSRHRDDDREETIRKRLQIYHQNTADLLSHYRAQGLLREVDGTGTIEQVFTQIVGLS